MIFHLFVISSAVQIYEFHIFTIISENKIVVVLLFTGAPGREAEFGSKAGAFEHQANQVADTAIKLANAGGNTNKRLLDQIRQNAEEVSVAKINCQLAE